ncbi:expressed unknown protein [Seminavis robusta]|uniref:Uncharacterized protein n=1 Tax=Seminavis robusta TaxID=568900 RepID=A0A9N8DDY1_9STRA|nr:expressed unknown protein [Seminavis robusta]|eukprot:Sro44_g026630.1 n/a (1320) ;mRNA; r:70751-74993
MAGGGGGSESAEGGTDVGTVCFEAIKEPSMSLSVVVTTKPGYNLVSSGLWVGDGYGGTMPVDDSGVPQAPWFPYTWSSTSYGETTWETSIVISAKDGTCGAFMTGFSMTTMTQVTVEDSAGTQLDAYSVEEDFDGSSSALYSGTEMMVDCECLCTEICVETPEDSSVREECHDLMVGANNGANVTAGQVCIEIVDDETKFQVTYTATGEWTLVSTEFWIGESISSVPLDDGELNSEAFPYFWCNSTGESEWVSKFDFKWSYNCLDMDSFTMALVGQATVAQVNSTTGEIVEDSEVVAFAYEYDGPVADDIFSWFDITVNCHCVKDCYPKEDKSGPGPGPTTPEICVKPMDGSSGPMEHQAVYAGNDTQIGAVSVSVSKDSSHLDVSFESTRGWTLLSTEYWIGDSIAAVPVDQAEGGALDVENFPYYWCNSTGETTHTSHVELKWSYLCEDEAEFSLVIVAQMTLGQVDSEGVLIEGTEVITYVTEHEVSTAEEMYGWFDVTVMCECIPDDRQPPKITGLCVADEEEEAKECQTVYGGDATEIGVVCVEVTGDDMDFEVTYTASDSWALLSTDLWVGEAVSAVPMDDGELDTENFPYFWCNSTGEDTHTSLVPLKWSYLCEESKTGGFHISFVTQLTVAKVNETTGEIIEGTEVMSYASVVETEINDVIVGYFDVPISCTCVKDRSASGLPDICVEDLSDADTPPTMECQELGDNVGSICVQMLPDGELEVHFEATGDWLFTNNEFWIGEDIASVPVDDEEDGGGLDVESFPYFWCNSTGEDTHRAHVPFKWSYLCEGEDEFSLVVVARSTVGKLDANGEISEEDSLVAYTNEFHGTVGDETIGWFDIKINCACPHGEITSTTTDKSFDTADDECPGGAVVTVKQIDTFNYTADLDTTTSSDEQNFTVPADADSISLTFLLEQKGSWDMDDKVVVSLNDIPVDLGAIEDYDHHANPTNAASGISGGIAWSRFRLDGGSYADKLHQVDVKIPGVLAADGVLAALFEFSTSESYDDQSASISDVAMTAGGSWCDKEMRRLDLSTSDAATPCNKDVVLFNEDYETGTAAGWANGLIALDETFGHFLGRLGRENRVMSKAFAVPAKAESLTVAFSVYTTGASAWKDTDQFRAKVGIADINLGDFTLAQASGTTQDVAWSRVEKEHNHHVVHLEVPREYFLAGKLSLALEVSVREGIHRKSAGVDNLVITAVGVNACDGSVEEGEDIVRGASGFRVSSLVDVYEPEAEAEEDEDEGRGYCHSEDFPCGDEEGMVNVCHYSITSGYQTYCLKESDSDLVRTYPDDYCGPCVGGYGGSLKDQKQQP